MLNKEQKILEITQLLNLEWQDLDKILSILKWENKEKVNQIIDRENQTNEKSLNDFLQKANTLRHNYNLLRPLNEENSLKIYDIYKTIVSIGATQKNVNSSNDLDDNEFWYERHIDNFLTNYKLWLWKKLFLSKEFIDEKSVDDIDNIASHYLNRAISHVNIYLNNFSIETSDILKSQYFDQIHNGEGKKTIFGLLKVLKQLKNREWLLKKEHKHSRREWINYTNVFQELKIAYWEIQRILALTFLYIDREKNQNYQHTSEDIDFVVKKFEDITSNTILNDGAINPESPLYHITNSQKYNWYKDENWEYKIKIWDEIDPLLPANQIIKLEWFDFYWRLRPYDKNKTKIKALHISSRMKKWPYSSVDKVIRKNLNTFNQIMDNKWFIIVVENFEDWKNLLKLLENEIWTWETSWLEEAVFMNKDWNKNTNAHYNCLKSTIKIPYKWKLIKEFFEMLEKHFKSNVSLLQKVKDLKNLCDYKNLDYKKVEELIWEEIQKSKKLREVYNNLKNKFRRKEYNIEVEIQIFDLQNYFKAEVDEESEAYHWHYKKRQVLDWLWYFFPIKIYWEKKLTIAANELLN